MPGKAIRARHQLDSHDNPGIFFKLTIFTYLQEGSYRLIHIPRSLFPSFLQPIIRVLLPQTKSLNLNDQHGPLEAASLEGLNSDQQHSFLNVSITPLESSIVVHNSWCSAVFEPVVSRLSRHDQRKINVSKDSYLVLSVISAGMDAGERVMELTSPLAMARIPIFFITTYYSDFILVPSRDRPVVVKALLERGFAFGDESERSFISVMPRSRRGSAERHVAVTQPPSTLAELQDSTFDDLRKHRVVPYVVEGLKLMHCSGMDRGQFDHQAMIGRYGNLRGVANARLQNTNERKSAANAAKARQSQWLESIDSKLYTAMISALVSAPTFLSVTLAQEDPPSLLLDTRLSGLFGNSLVGGAGEACMGGEDGENSLVPIFLDLSALPPDATGIVSGVAGRLMSEMRDDTKDGRGVSSELSYLSTAKAGVVILSGEQSRRALEVMAPLLA